MPRHPTFDDLVSDTSDEPGAAGKAPCGHPGVFFGIGRFVLCSKGCDDLDRDPTRVPAPIEAEITKPICHHPGQFYYGGVVRCTQCDQVLRIRQP